MKKTKLIGMIVSLTMLLSAALIPTTIASAAEDRVNLALASNGAVITSSDDYDGGYLATNANDGDMSTRWACQWLANVGVEDPREIWLQVDLGEAKDIKEVYVTHEFEAAEAPYKFKVEVSNDGSTWTTFSDFSENANLKGYLTLKGDANARYIRLNYFWESGASGFPSVWEFEVYSTESDTPADTTDAPVPEVGEGNGGVEADGRTNLAWHKDTTSSEDYNASYPAVFATDGDSETRWASKMGGDERDIWLQVDLGEVKAINEIGISFEHAAATEGAYRFRLEISEDGENWFVFVNRWSNYETVGDFAFAREAAANARYVKASFHYQGGFPSVRELRVFDSVGDGATVLTNDLVPSENPTTSSEATEPDNTSSEAAGNTETSSEAANAGTDNEDGGNGWVVPVVIVVIVVVVIAAVVVAVIVSKKKAAK